MENDDLIFELEEMINDFKDEDAKKDAKSNPEKFAQFIEINEEFRQ